MLWHGWRGIIVLWAQFGSCASRYNCGLQSSRLSNSPERPHIYCQFHYLYGCTVAPQSLEKHQIANSNSLSTCNIRMSDLQYYVLDKIRVLYKLVMCSSKWSQLISCFALNVRFLKLFFCYLGYWIFGCHWINCKQNVCVITSQWYLHFCFIMLHPKKEQYGSSSKAMCLGFEHITKHISVILFKCVKAFRTSMKMHQNV